MRPVKLGIAILQWNSSSNTLGLLDDLLPYASMCPIVVCDNGSNPEHKQALLDFLSACSKEGAPAEGESSVFPTTLIANKYNSGFAVGMNLCIERLLSQGVEWVWLLNNDTLVDGSVTCCMDLLSKLEPAIYGTKMLDMESGAVSYGKSFNRWMTTVRDIVHINGDQPSKRFWYVDGASMILHRKLIDEVGLLGESCFMYYEELDYKLRAEKLGYTQKVLTGVEVRHLQGGSLSTSLASRTTKMYHETFSTLQFYKNHYPLYLPVVLVLRTIFRVATLLIKKRAKEIPPVMKATRDFLFSGFSLLQPANVVEEHIFYLNDQ